MYLVKQYIGSWEWDQFLCPFVLLIGRPVVTKGFTCNKCPYHTDRKRKEKRKRAMNTAWHGIVRSKKTKQ